MDEAVRHVVLVGLMGAGKTTVGRRVAQRLDVPFVDADAALEERTGRTIADWFAQHGEAAFRDAEADVLTSLLSEPQRTVIATGGGVVERAENRTLLCAPDVRVVWLRGTPGLLARRATQKGPKPHRPLLADDPLATLTRLDGQRGPLYAEVADVVVDIDPVHDGDPKPKRRLAELVLEAL